MQLDFAAVRDLLLWDRNQQGANTMTLLFPTWGHLIAYLAHSKRGSVSRKQGQWVFKEATGVQGMNPNQLGRTIQGGSAETKQEQRKRSDRQAALLYRGRHEAEKIREERELQQIIGD